MVSFQDSSSFVIEQLIYFHDFIISILVLIITVVGLNMVFMCINSFSNRFFLENQIIETVWTICPIIILLFIAIPSLRILYLLDDPFSVNLTIKAIGNQWYWRYEYSDFCNIFFDSYMVSYNEPDNLRLLEVDNSLVLPVNINIRVVTTANDVIHSWTIPSLGVKSDSVPGRLNHIIFCINRVGVFYGQCSEICGTNHRFMPIKLESVPMGNFVNWLKSYE